MFNEYRVKLTLLRRMLATNPCDPNVLDTHIIGKQRKLILDKSKVNAQINKYLGALDISRERGEKEIELLFVKLEEMTGISLTDEEKKLALEGKLDSLKETFKGMDMAGTTVFFWDQEQDRPCIGDHMVYGFLKAAGEAVSRTKDRKNGKMLHSAAHTSKIINQHTSCVEEFITLSNDIVRDADGNAVYLQRSLRAETAQGPRVTLAKSEQVPAGTTLEFTLKILEGSELTEDILKELFDYGQLKGLGQWRNASNGQFTAEIKKIK